MAVDREIKIKKKMLSPANVWEDRTFIKLPKRNSDRFSNKDDIENWCREHYGAPKYQGSWWVLPTAGYVILDEKVYVHWKLCE